jgi:hypothetical protein
MTTLTTTETVKFEEGNIYQMRFIGDSNLKPEFICVSRTAKTATFERYQKTERLTRRIKIWGGVEYILEGSYSMAPSIQADKVVG